MASTGLTGRLKWLWAFILLIAVAEIVLQWWIPRAAPEPADWQSAREAVNRAKGRHDLVLVTPDWARPTGRMHLGHLISRDDFGRFDTTLYDRIIEVSVNGSRAEETRGLERQSEQQIGPMAVRIYKTATPRATVIYDFKKMLGSAKPSGFRLFRPRFMIDHRYHVRLAVPVSLGRGNSGIEFPDVPLGGVLRGYAFIGRTSGEFDRGGPVKMVVSVNGNRAGKAEFTNLGPLNPFEIGLPGTGRGTVRFDFSASDFLKREFGFTADVRLKTGGAP